MRPYKRNGPCPKCGLTSEVDFEGRVTNDIGTRYNGPQKVRVSEQSYNMTTECLVRFCGRCHYEWAEACVDSQEPE